MHVPAIAIHFVTEKGHRDDERDYSQECFTVKAIMP